MRLIRQSKEARRSLGSGSCVSGGPEFRRCKGYRRASHDIHRSTLPSLSAILAGSIFVDLQCRSLWIHVRIKSIGILRHGVTHQNVFTSRSNMDLASSCRANWYYTSDRCRKILLLIMNRTILPCKLTAGKIITLSIESFGTVNKVPLSLSILPQLLPRSAFKVVSFFEGSKNVDVLFHNAAFVQITTTNMSIRQQARLTKFRRSHLRTEIYRSTVTDMKNTRRAILREGYFRM